MQTKLLKKLRKRFVFVYESRYVKYAGQWQTMFVWVAYDKKKQTLFVPTYGSTDRPHMEALDHALDVLGYLYLAREKVSKRYKLKLDRKYMPEKYRQKLLPDKIEK